MSHIVKGKVQVAYKDKKLLIKALQSVGRVLENDKLYRFGAGYTIERYDLVMEDLEDTTHRLGYKHRNGIWEQYQENYGLFGEWTDKVSQKIQDNYIAFYYEEQLTNEGFNVTITHKNDGSLELVAEEPVW